MSSARAAVFVAPGEPFSLREFPLAEPLPGEVLVRITQANVCGSDVHIWRGEMEKMGRLPPTVLGHEMTGTIAVLGKGVRTDFLGQPVREGDRIAWLYYRSCGRCRVCVRGMPYACLMSLASVYRPCEAPPHFVGGFAEYYVIQPGQAFFRAPEELSDSELAGANCALSQVWFGFQRAGLRAGESVVIQGAGGLGLYAAAVARVAGAEPIIVIDALPARLEFAREMGADVTLSLTDYPHPRERTARVLELTGGWGADLVVEVAGSPAPYPEGIRMLARGGRYLALGSVVPGQTFAADPSLLIGPNRSLVGVSLYPPSALAEAIGFLARHRERFPFARLAGATFPLEDIDRAFQAADAARAQGAVPTRIGVRPHAQHDRDSGGEAKP